MLTTEGEAYYIFVDSLFINAVGKGRPVIYFFSASSEMFDVIKDEFFEKWSFHLVTLPASAAVIDLQEVPELIILDTLSLKLDLLEHIKEHPIIGKSPVLVIDNYQEQVLIDKIIEMGASGYLHVDSFLNHLDQMVKKIIHRPKLHFILF